MWPEDYGEAVADLVEDCPSLSAPEAGAQVDLQADVALLSEAVHARYPDTYAGWVITPCAGVVLLASDPATIYAIEAMADDRRLVIETKLVAYSYSQLEDFARRVEEGAYTDILGDQVAAQVDVELNLVGAWAPDAEPGATLPPWLVVSDRYAPSGDVPE